MPPGRVVHLGERECSIQRRHQKIVEEAPSPFLSPPSSVRPWVRARRSSWPASLGYRSAGTVEFLVDDDTGQFWFLEVNTRLQVEHPVTEEVTGRDLVRDQLLVAMGHPLDPIDQTASVDLEGHAIEVRLYAEDPGNDFLPSPPAPWWPSTADVRAGAALGQRGSRRGRSSASSSIR